MGHELLERRLVEPTEQYWLETWPHAGDAVRATPSGREGSRSAHADHIDWRHHWLGRWVFACRSIGYGGV